MLTSQKVIDAINEPAFVETSVFAEATNVTSRRGKQRSGVRSQRTEIRNGIDRVRAPVLIQAKLFADRTGERVFDFGVTWDRRNSAVCRI